MPKEREGQREKKTILREKESPSSSSARAIGKGVIGPWKKTKDIIGSWRSTISTSFAKK